MAYKIPIPPNPKTAKLSYKEFKGVNFSLDQTVLPRGYSQQSKNVFINETGVIQTRWGTKKIASFTPDPTGIFGITIKGQPRLFIISGGVLYEMVRVGLEPFSKAVEVGRGFSLLPSRAFVYGSSLWVLDGVTYHRLSFPEDGDPLLQKVSEIAYIPTTSIASAPDGVGRTPFEGVNLLSHGRINGFSGDGTAKIYLLDARELMEKEIEVKINGELLEKSKYTVDYLEGKVTFTQAPPAPDLLGEDNVTICYYKVVPEHQDKLNKATIFSQFGRGGDQRIFLSGNPDYPGCDWFCGYNDPTYFPDMGETKIGKGDSPIMGYLPIGSEQAVIMGESANGSSTVYLRLATSDELGETIFLMEAGISGYDGVSKGCFSIYEGDGYYLTDQGIFSISSGNLNLEKSLISRSRGVNRLITLPPSMPEHILRKDYEMISFKGYLFITNGRELLVGDGRFGKGELQWYLWDKVYIRRFAVLDGSLFFTNMFGELGCFLDTESCPERFTNELYYPEVVFATIPDDDGDSSALKRLARDSLFLRIKTYGCRILVTLQFDDGSKITHMIPKDQPDNDGVYAIRSLFLGLRSEAYRTLSISLMAVDRHTGFELYELSKKFHFTADTP